MKARTRALAAPAATTVVALAVLAFVRVVDPAADGNPYPPCPVRALLGLECPGCGMLRATHALLHGDVATALDRNVLSIAVWAVAVAAWAVWTARSWRDPRAALTAASPPPRSQLAQRARPVLAVGALAVVLAFGIVRNLVPWLGSGLG